MITINLLPKDLRPIKRTPVPYIASGSILLCVLFGIGVIFLSTQAKVNQAQNKYMAHKNELNALLPVVEEYNALSEQKSQLAEQVKTIDDIASDRIIWSRQLYNISRLALDNSWFRNIRVSVKPFTEFKKVVNAETGTTDYEPVTVQKQVLTLSGYVIPGEEGTADMSPMTNRFAEDPEFSNMFEIDLPSFTDTYVDGTAVREFVLEYVYGGSETDQ